jgi:methyl-accepting chemotaxis protein
MHDLEAALRQERALAQDAADALEVCGRRLDALAAQNIIRGHQIETLEAERDRLAAEARRQADATAALTLELQQTRAALAAADIARETLARDGEALARDREALVRERDALTRERDGLVQARDVLTGERDALAIDRDALRARFDEPRYVVADRVSRALRPLGPVKRVLRRAARALAGSARPGPPR